jgi:S-adenosylmethionine hydrolase
MKLVKRFGAGLILLLCALLAGCGSTANREAQKEPARQPVIVFMTDFGTANDAVAICKAVITKIVPDVRIMDITHQVTPYSIEEGARFLSGVTPYYGPGTVFLAVVDPGVGTSRKAVVVKSKKGQYFVLPDNGLITPVADRDGVEGAREITNTNWMIGAKVSSTFHGRDIFSPAAAHLAAGEDWTLVGPEVKQLVRLTPREAKVEEKGISGEIFALDDPFGSLISDIPGDEFKKLGYALGENVRVRVGEKTFIAPYSRTFMDVAVGEPLLYVDSRGRMELGLNQRNFSQVNKITLPVAVFIPRKGK